MIPSVKSTSKVEARSSKQENAKITAVFLSYFGLRISKSLRLGAGMIRDRAWILEHEPAKLARLRPVGVASGRVGCSRERARRAIARRRWPFGRAVCSVPPGLFSCRFARIGRGRRAHHFFGQGRQKNNAISKLA
jgi:hypothetical protein